MGCGSTKLLSRDREGIGWPSIPVRAAFSLEAPMRSMIRLLLLEFLAFRFVHLAQAPLNSIPHLLARDRGAVGELGTGDLRMDAGGPVEARLAVFSRVTSIFPVREPRVMFHHATAPLGIACQEDIPPRTPIISCAGQRRRYRPSGCLFARWAGPTRSSTRR